MTMSNDRLTMDPDICVTCPECEDRFGYACPIERTVRGHLLDNGWKERGDDELICPNCALKQADSKEYLLFGAERYEDGILTRLVLTTRDGGTDAITMEGDSTPWPYQAVPQAMDEARADYYRLAAQRFAALNP